MTEKLHAFQKKSTSDIAAGRVVIEKRSKAVLARYGMSGRT